MIPQGCSKGPTIDTRPEADAYQTDFEDETAATLTKVARWVQAATPSVPHWVSDHKSA